MARASYSEMVPFLLLLLAVSGAAQTPARKAPAGKKAAPAKAVQTKPADQKSWPLVSITVQGNKMYSEEQVVRASGLKIGQTVENADFETARERLMKTGAFESVGYRFGPDAEGKGYTGTLAVQEVEQVYGFRFEDLPASDAELRAYLKNKEPIFEARIPGTKEFLDRTAAAVKEMVAAKGFKDNVIGKLAPDGTGELVVVFRPATGPPAIGEVKFTGNQVLPAATLNNAFGLVAVGVPFTEKRVRELLETSIRPLYEARGRLRVSFPKIETKKMASVDGVSVTVAVDEGPGFKLGEVKATGSPIPPKELVAAANLKPGDVANFVEVQAAVERIQRVFRTQGFMKSETTFERQIHDKTQSVDVAFRTASGQRYSMGKLTIEGLDVTTEPAIRKLWSMTAGKPYNADYPQFFLNRVREDGYLDNLGDTRFTQNVNESTRTVDVTLQFKGTPPPAKKPAIP